ncbi:hypothetical protein ACFOD4_00885, partial [Pseudoroseomonas globiformis]
PRQPKHQPSQIRPNQKANLTKPILPEKPDAIVNQRGSVFTGFKQARQPVFLPTLSAVTFRLLGG